ncbi:hypothetical protein M9979_13940 [Sphingomonas sp. RP10(2022)]|uniref:Uncharacterized protein n=1 Tax=Sphingomonas liriopis TaxID=2949094 RepID=A0A9X2KRF1_9SPHN|nr:hypothetical protein [Sphingomonas liriopis]MCP3735970.1 hypothetical protein [Sphingomonas liriopis]
MMTVSLPRYSARLARFLADRPLQMARWVPPRTVRVPPVAAPLVDATAIVADASLILDVAA